MSMGTIIICSIAKRCIKGLLHSLQLKKKISNATLKKEKKQGHNHTHIKDEPHQQEFYKLEEINNIVQ